MDNRARLDGTRAYCTDLQLTTRSASRCPARHVRTPTPAPLTIRGKKSTDGGVSLTCLRSDGTSSWQRPEEAHASYFHRPEWDAVPKGARLEETFS